MDRQLVLEELKAIIGAHLKEQGLDLVELIYRYEGRDLVLRVLTDRPEGGISLGECAVLNQEISALLDGEDILQERYILEVSSPGLDRPLKTKGDFLRCINKKARFFLREAINGKWELEGTINKVEDDAVCIDVSGRVIVAPLSKINQAKQII